MKKDTRYIRKPLSYRFFIQIYTTTYEAGLSILFILIILPYSLLIIMSESRSSNAAHAKPTPVQEKHPQPSRDVQVRLQYLKDDPIYLKQKPLQITPNFLDTEGRTNVRLEPGELETIHDVRGREAEFTLDANGFQYVKAPTTFQDWSSQPAIAQQYLPELEKVLRREVDGCDEIMFYDARIRHADDAGLRVEGLSYNPFAKQVHTDNTERSVLTKIKNLTDMKADYLLSGRARIINIWWASYRYCFQI